MIIKLLAGAILGGAIGFLYHRLVGCKTGTCPIVANPYSSTIYGVLMGTLIASIL